VYSKGKLTALCNHCGRRWVLQLGCETLYYHKLKDKSGKCPGASTKDYSFVEPCKAKKKKQKRTPKLIDVKPPSLRVRTPDTQLYVSTKSFRSHNYESWLNRWERKFGVKIPEENVRNLTNKSYIRSSK